MGTAAPGVEMGAGEDLTAETALERSQRPSTRPTTACESRATTGEPLWPRFTGWLRRKLRRPGKIYRAAWTRKKELHRKSGLRGGFQMCGHSAASEDVARARERLGREMRRRRTAAGTLLCTWNRKGWEPRGE